MGKRGSMLFLLYFVMFCFPLLLIRFILYYFTLFYQFFVNFY